MTTSTRAHNGGLKASETFTTKGIGKDEAKQLVAQMTNFSIVYATIEGCAVIEGSEEGGIFLRNAVKVFKDKKFVLKHRWKDIILKIREYAKRDGTVFNNLFNVTQIAEDESTLEKPVSFASKYLPHSHDHDEESGQECTSITIVNVSKKNKIAVRVETEQSRDNRRKELNRLTNANCFDEFKHVGFEIINSFGGCQTFNKVWDECYVTIFKLTNLGVKNEEICDRQICHDQVLYFLNQQLVGIPVALPPCNARMNETHALHFDLGSDDEYSEVGCAFCASKKIICYCKECNHGLCASCCHLVICQQTHLRLDVSQSIVSIDYLGELTLQVTCRLSQKWIERIKDWLTNSDKINSLILQYQLQWIITYNDHGTITKKKY